MNTTRRTILTGALAAPLMAQFTTTAHGATPDDKWGTISKASMWIQWTPETLALFKRHKVTVKPISPAELAEDGNGLRLPVRSATGDPTRANLAQAQGSGVLDGGMVVGTPGREFRVTELQSRLEDERVFGTFAVNGVNVGPQPVFTCALGESRLVAEPAEPGQPHKVLLPNVAMRSTRETLDALAIMFGVSTLTTESILAYATAEGVYTPPPQR